MTYFFIQNLSRRDITAVVSSIVGVNKIKK